MAQERYNEELMALNSKQLDDQVTRSEVRRQRRQILESILDNREEFSYRSLIAKSKGLVTGLVIFAVVAAGFLLYLLALE